MNMRYINNQYIRLDIPLEEIAKIKIKTDKNNKMISDLDIKDYEPNVIIAFGINGKIDYCNIYSSVRILRTSQKTLMGKIEEIPEFIEVIIVDNLIYYNKNDVNSDKDFDLLRFENNEDRFEMKVERLIERGKLNSCNNVGDTILKNFIWRKKGEKAIELINKMEIESINKVNKYGNTALMLACFEENMKTVALKLLEREEININQVNKYGYTALICACIYKMESVALKLLEREDININQANINGDTALIWACANKMETIALKLLERKEININQMNEDGYTALIWACINKMELVALKLLERKEININQENNRRKTALDYAIENNMESVINKIKELQK